jgi:hypothetical protein
VGPFPQFRAIHVVRMKQNKIHEFYLCSTLVNQFMINNCISINYFQLLRISNRDMDCPAHVLWFSRNFIKLKKSPCNFNEVLFPHTNCYLLYNCHPENKYVNTLPSISILYINTFFHFFHFFFSIKQVLSPQHRMANRKHVILLAGILIRWIDIFRRKYINFIFYFVISQNSY